MTLRRRARCVCGWDGPWRWLRQAIFEDYDHHRQTVHLFDGAVCDPECRDPQSQCAC